MKNSDMNRSVFNPFALIHSHNVFRAPAVFALALMFTVISGCSDPVGAPVKLNTAQQILSGAMECWKEGKTPKDLLAASPPVFVQEQEWNDGVTLVDYEIISNDQPVGPNLIATVKLKLEKPAGKVTEKTATYVVGTSPSLTVYRNIMR